jgi:hypothetical protein
MQGTTADGASDLRGAIGALTFKCVNARPCQRPFTHARAGDDGDPPRVWHLDDRAPSRRAFTRATLESALCHRSHRSLPEARSIGRPFAVHLAVVGWCRSVVARELDGLDRAHRVFIDLVNPLRIGHHRAPTITQYHPQALARMVAIAVRKSAVHDSF